MSDDSLAPAKLAAAKDGVLDIILQEADKRVAAQVQLMLAADARASGILTGCTTLAAAGIGFAVTKLAAREPIFWASITFGVLEALAALLALGALWPVEIAPQGWAPRTFRTDLKKGKPTVQAEIAIYMDERILKNRNSADKLSGRVKGAMLIGSQGPFVGLCVALFASGHGGWSIAFSLLTIVPLLWLGIPLIPGAYNVRASRRSQN